VRGTLLPLRVVPPPTPRAWVGRLRSSRGSSLRPGLFPLLSSGPPRLWLHRPAPHGVRLGRPPPRPSARFQLRATRSAPALSPFVLSLPASRRAPRLPCVPRRGSPASRRSGPSRRSTVGPRPRLRRDQFHTRRPPAPGRSRLAPSARPAARTPGALALLRIASLATPPRLRLVSQRAAGFLSPQFRWLLLWGTSVRRCGRVALR